MATATQTEKAAGRCDWPTMASIEENLREARRAVNAARHAAEDAVSEAELKIRRHPLTAVGAAAVAGAIAGGVVGLGAAWYGKHRRSANGG